MATSVAVVAKQKRKSVKKASRYSLLWAHFTTDTVPSELQATHFRCRWCVKNLHENGAGFAGYTAEDEIRNIRRVTTRDACVHIYKCPFVPPGTKESLMELLATHVKEVRMPRHPHAQQQALDHVLDQDDDQQQAVSTNMNMIGNKKRGGGGIGTTYSTIGHRQRLKQQECIGAIRSLAKQGMLTADQKRVLLTDIITCSARGGEGENDNNTNTTTSNVQMAYELLVPSSGDDKEEGLLEFADQCRVFAEDFLYGSGNNNLHHHPSQGTSEIRDAHGSM